MVDMLEVVGKKFRVGKAVKDHLSDLYKDGCTCQFCVRERDARRLSLQTSNLKGRCTGFYVKKAPNSVLACEFDGNIGCVTFDITKDSAIIEEVVENVIPTLPGEVEVGLSNTVTVGSDPEVFVEDQEGRLIPAWKVVRKKKRHRRDVGEAFADGFAVEVTIEPATCHESVVNNIRDALLGAAAWRDGLRISEREVVDVGEWLAEGRDEDVELGCSPSLNIYGREHIRVEGRRVGFRSAGFHVHYGLPEWVLEKRLGEMVRGMDLMTGVLGVSLFEGMVDGRRRHLYGRAGEYRLPKHGLEYRVMGSEWLRHPALAHLGLDLCRAGLWSGVLGEKWDGVDWEEVERVVNEYDVKGARRVIGRCWEGVERLVRRVYYEGDVQEVTLGVIKRGLRSNKGLMGELGSGRVADRWESRDSVKWVYASEAGF